MIILFSNLIVLFFFSYSDKIKRFASVGRSILFTFSIFFALCFVPLPPFYSIYFYGTYKKTVENPTRVSTNGIGQESTIVSKSRIYRALAENGKDSGTNRRNPP